MELSLALNITNPAILNIVLIFLALQWQNLNVEWQNIATNWESLG